MTVSSRTPEGEPVRCHLCDEPLLLEPSPEWSAAEQRDATCPNCGCLVVWAQDQPEPAALADIRARMARFHELDSLETVELIMEMSDVSSDPECRDALARRPLKAEIAIQDFLAALQRVPQHRERRRKKRRRAQAT